AAGVSIATVSASLNDVESARISADTRARARAVADRLGYAPNRLAQGLRVQRSGTIGFVGDTVATTPYAGRWRAARPRPSADRLHQQRGPHPGRHRAARQLLELPERPTGVFCEDRSPRRPCDLDGGADL
ncbi:MAG TPA: LacI family DNA-binding transcriptional regulator, partial [Actinomycetota bacterium]|nr:LacI family DNA-binding transcriptional regulator [Actinomycetota bacterium]